MNVMCIGGLLEVRQKRWGLMILKRKETGQDPEFSLSSEKPQKDLKGVTHTLFVF